MVRSLSDLRSRLYLRVLNWLGDGRLRHCDVARDRDGEVVAITFARDLGYIEQIREIDSKSTNTIEDIERRLRRRVTVLSIALAILAVGITLEELAERLVG